MVVCLKIFNVKLKLDLKTIWASLFKPRYNYFVEMPCQFNSQRFKAKLFFNVGFGYPISKSFQRFFSLCLDYSLLVTNSLVISSAILMEIIFKFIVLPIVTILISFSFLFILFPCLVPPGLPLQDLYHLFIN